MFTRSRPYHRAIRVMPKKKKTQTPIFGELDRGECTRLDGGEYTKVQVKIIKTKCHFSIRTKTPTLVNNVEHEVSVTTSAHMVKATKTGCHLTQERTSSVCFPMTCVTIVARFSPTAQHLRRHVR